MNKQDRTTQDVLEDLFRHDAKVSGCTSGEIESLISEFRQTFAGHYDHAPSPEVLAMVADLKQEATDFARHHEHAKD
jgi:hypothetical protein